MASEVELEHRIQNLPQELQDGIFEYYLIIPAETVVINKTYKPPAHLQINRAMREKLAKEYYGHITFTLEGDRSTVETTCSKWLSSLPSQHLDIVARVRIESFHGKKEEWRRMTNNWLAHGFFLMRLEAKGVYLRWDALRYRSSQV
ncbi:hypothetical protein PRZ48_014280 [Zasmidium cellare]|uniref:Uncharacterized protein n=1 Tax=Zasmidium cellare TaxID=395010 RepID=A0ABR0E0T0_ZASCE|nr:hypothetical protein PRZ48_014280 [Zasmidium cellare]